MFRRHLSLHRVWKRQSRPARFRACLRVRSATTTPGRQPQAAMRREIRETRHGRPRGRSVGPHRLIDRRHVGQASEAEDGTVLQMADSRQPPSRSREERIAYNEDWCRDLNERKAGWIKQGQLAAGFRCECWQLDCGIRIRLTGTEWDEIRSRPNRFAVAPGTCRPGGRNGYREAPSLLERRETRRGGGRGRGVG